MYMKEETKCTVTSKPNILVKIANNNAMPTCADFVDIRILGLVVSDIHGKQMM